MREIIILLLFSINSYSQCISGDCVNGYGEKKIDDEEIYKGNFSNGKRDGFGVSYFSNGVISFIGYWKDDTNFDGLDYFENASLVNIWVKGDRYDKKIVSEYKFAELFNERKDWDTKPALKRLEFEKIENQKRLEQEKVENERKIEQEKIQTQKRLEQERIETQKKVARERQIEANSNKTMWTLGSKICNELDNGILMGTINQWNENKSMAQIKILAGPKGNYEGEEIKKNELIWVQASGAGWHVCLADEIKTAVASDQSGKNNSGQMGGTTSNQQIAVRYIKSFGKKLKSTCLKKTFTQELQSEIQNIEYKEDTKMYVVKVTYSWTDKDFFDQYTRQIFGGVLIFDEYGCNSTFFISDKTESNLIFGTGSCAYKLDYNMIEKLKNVVPNAKYGMSMGCLDD